MNAIDLRGPDGYLDPEKLRRWARENMNRGGYRRPLLFRDRGHPRPPPRDPDAERFKEPTP